MELYGKIDHSAAVELLVHLTGVSKELWLTSLISRNSNKRRLASLHRHLSNVGMQIHTFEDNFDLMLVSGKAVPSIEVYYDSPNEVKLTYFSKKIEDIASLISWLKGELPAHIFKVKGRCPCGCREIKHSWGTPDELLVYVSEWFEKAAS